MSEKKSAADLFNAVAGGLSSGRAAEIWEEAGRNIKRLDECAGPHDFTVIGEVKPLTQKYRCALCGGEVGSRERTWYLAGLAHGRAHPAK